MLISVYCMDTNTHSYSQIGLWWVCVGRYVCMFLRIHVYRQSQMRKPTGSGVEWAECSLIIGTGCRVQVFSLILKSSVGLSAGIQSAGDLVSETLGSNPVFRRTRQLVSFRFEYRLPVPELRNQQQQTCLLPEPGANTNWPWARVSWMVADHRDGLSSSNF